jgi:signal transduction histidine kinase
VTFERGKLLVIVDQMDAVHDQHELLTEVNAGLTHSIVTLQNILNNGDIESRSLDIQLDLASFSQNLFRLRGGVAAIGSLTDTFKQLSAHLSKGTTRDALIALRDTEQALAEAVEHIEAIIEHRNNVLRKEYSDLNKYITVFVLGMNLFGFSAFGVVAALFLSRLARDVGALETRAVAIVNGYRGQPFEVRRSDEVGALMEALNRMQSRLRQREHQQEISMQQRFHQEKMAAVGSLAATVAHEVSNPINSISGIAQHTIEALRSQEGLDRATLCRNAELTLTQTERIGSIMRRLSDLSAPRSPEPEPIDVNELVRLTCSFIRYDRRLRHISLVTELDHDLPAVRAVADHLTQILMNLLINAADALEGRAAARPSS